MLNNKFFLLAVALFAVSSSAWVVRILPETSAITLAFWRMFLACIVAFIFSYKTIGYFVPTKKMELAGIFLGFHFALFFRAVQLTSIPEATLLGTTAPVFTELYRFVFKKRGLSVSVFLGLFVAFSGAIFLISQQPLNDTGLIGNLLAVLCSLSMAIVLIVGKEIRKKTSVLDYTRWLFFYASATLLFVSFFFPAVDVFSFSSKEFGWFLFLALVPTMVGHNIFYYLIKSLSATTVAAVPLGEPVISSVGALFIFGEGVGFGVLVGGLITLLGVFIIIKYGEED
tara:strand:+ start:2814 stop:3665 length:852 start_codon:yes stop_codon:yes gene_type:complete